MRKIKPWAVAAILVALSACQKEPSFGPSPVGSLKVKTYTEDVTSDALGDSHISFNLSYDGNDRLSSMVDASNAGNKFVYAYPSASTFTMELYVNNSLEIHADYYLNSHSLIDSAFQYNSTDDTSTTKYIYNTSWQLTKQYDYEYSTLHGSSLSVTTENTYDGDGNLIKTEDSDGLVYLYEYYTDKVYLTPQITPFTGGNQKAPLLKKETIVAGQQQLSSNFTYTFDSKDRVSTITQITDQGDKVVKTFTYFD